MINKIADDLDMDPKDLVKSFLQGVLAAPLVIVFVYAVFGLLGLAGGMW